MTFFCVWEKGIYKEREEENAGGFHSPDAGTERAKHLGIDERLNDREENEHCERRQERRGARAREHPQRFLAIRREEPHESAERGDEEESVPHAQTTSSLPSFARLFPLQAEIPSQKIY